MALKTYAIRLTEEESIAVDFLVRYYESSTYNPGGRFKWNRSMVVQHLIDTQMRAIAQDGKTTVKELLDLSSKN